jgi:hypothetical protein
VQNSTATTVGGQFQVIGPPAAVSASKPFHHDRQAQRAVATAITKMRVKAGDDARLGPTLRAGILQVAVAIRTVGFPLSSNGGITLASPRAPDVTADRGAKSFTTVEEGIMSRSFVSFTALALLAAAYPTSAQAGPPTDPHRQVVFHGESMTCQGLYDLSEDEDVAGRFQPLRRNAIDMRTAVDELSGTVQRVDDLVSWNRALWQAVYAVEAFDLAMSVITGTAWLEIVLEEGAQALNPASPGNVLRDWARDNDEDMIRRRDEMLADIAAAETYADYWEQQSSDLIQGLMDARVVLREECGAEPGQDVLEAEVRTVESHPQEEVAQPTYSPGGSDEVCALYETTAQTKALAQWGADQQYECEDTGRPCETNWRGAEKRWYRCTVLDRPPLQVTVCASTSFTAAAEAIQTIGYSTCTCEKSTNICGTGWLGETQVDFECQCR